MVATTGNAPVFSALQADANLSQLSSLKKKFTAAAPGNFTRLVLLTQMLYFQYFISLSAFALRRILRSLGLFWSSLVMNRSKCLL